MNLMSLPSALDDLGMYEAADRLDGRLIFASRKSRHKTLLQNRYDLLLSQLSSENPDIRKSARERLPAMRAEILKEGLDTRDQMAMGMQESPNRPWTSEPTPVARNAAKHRWMQRAYQELRSQGNKWFWSEQKLFQDLWDIVRFSSDPQVEQEVADAVVDMIEFVRSKPEPETFASHLPKRPASP